MNQEESVFQHLKEILVQYSDGMDVLIDESQHYYLNTHHIMKNKKPLYFGSTKINKQYVSFHLMPVYVFPELLEQVSPELRGRMQGKSCFNFKHVNQTMFRELQHLTNAGYERYKKADYV